MAELSKYKFSTNILFPKTIKLLDMMFHQYYHEIFLGEKDWMDEFNIKIE